MVKVIRTTSETNMIQTKNPDTEETPTTENRPTIRDILIKHFLDYPDIYLDKQNGLDIAYKEFAEALPLSYTESKLRENLENLQYTAEHSRKEPPKKITAYLRTDNQVQLDVDGMREARPLDTDKGRAQLRAVLRQYQDYQICPPDDPDNARRFPFFKRNITFEELTEELSPK